MDMQATTETTAGAIAAELGLSQPVIDEADRIHKESGADTDGDLETAATAVFVASNSIGTAANASKTDIASVADVPQSTVESGAVALCEQAGYDPNKLPFELDGGADTADGSSGEQLSEDTLDDHTSGTDDGDGDVSSEEVSAADTADGTSSDGPVGGGSVSDDSLGQGSQQNDEGISITDEREAVHIGVYDGANQTDVFTSFVMYLVESERLVEEVSLPLTPDGYSKPVLTDDPSEYEDTRWEEVGDGVFLRTKMAKRSKENSMEALAAKVGRDITFDAAWDEI